MRVEMLPDHAFYYFGKQRGAGGLPIGTGGRVACLLSGGIDSPVAAWRMMRRGCSVQLMHFHSYPFLSHTSQDKARELAEVLTRYQLRIAALSRAVRRAAAADLVSRAGAAPRRHLPALDDPHRGAPRARGGRARS